MKAMYHGRAREVHQRAFAGNHRDSMLFAELDCRRRAGAAATRAIKPDTLNASVNAIAHENLGHRRRRHEQHAVNRWIDLTQTPKTGNTVNHVAHQMHRYGVISTRSKLAEKSVRKVSGLARYSDECEALLGQEIMNGIEGNHKADAEILI